MNQLEKIKKRRQTEHHKGDVRKACEMAGVLPPVFQSAMKKMKIEDLNEKEIKVLLAYEHVLNERKNMLEEIKQQIK